MQCPVCKSELVPGSDQRFETLEEHVMAPNMEVHPLRPTLECPRVRERQCVMLHFWDYDGYYYGFAYGTPKPSSALGSSAREYDNEELARKKKEAVFFRKWWCWFCKPWHNFSWWARRRWWRSKYCRP